MSYRRALVSIVVGACGGSSARSDAAPDVPAAPDASATLGAAFRFAVVGDTRPANEDDLAGYPTAVITQIWADVEANSPHPDFAVSTGDYMFASPTHVPSTVDHQLDLYLGARMRFTNATFPVIGNHECTGAVPSNCGPGAADGVTANYAGFMRRMLGPFGITTPYYAIDFQAIDGSWTTKLVFVAANAWSSAQATWLEQTLASPTTYTFVIRHEGAIVSFAPGVNPSEAIIANHPVTLKIVGHAHTYAHGIGEVIVGTGGAPLTTPINYGYAIVERLATGVIQLTEYDYATHGVVDQFRINADGTPVP